MGRRSNKDCEIFEEIAKEDEKRLINELRNLRQTLLVSQKELGDKCGLAQSSLCRFENCDSGQGFMLRTFIRIAKALGYELCLKPINSDTDDVSKLNEVFSFEKDLPKELNLTEKKVYKFIYENSNCGRSIIIQNMNFSSRTVDRAIASLAKKNLIEYSGNYVNRVWHVKNK